MSNAKETYQVRRSEFTRQEPWILEALADSGSTAGFFLQFQSCFGRSAAPNETEDFKGLYMSQHDMAALMESVGVKYTQKTISNHLSILVEKGVVSRAPVCDPGFLEHSSKRIVWVYIINKTTPREFDRLAEKIALKMLDDSKYKGQAKNSAKKKEREAVGETNTIVAAREIARRMTDNNQLKGYVVDYLQDPEATVKAAATAVQSVKAYGKVSKGAFESGLKDFAIRFTMEEEKAIASLRDHLNRARQMDRKPAEMPVERTEYTPAPIPTPSRVFKTPEQLKEEEQAKRDDILAEKERMAQLTFEEMLATIEL